ncbi:MAG: MFS transporter [Planctomycetes bacterium]|nr:MFS transporter [Planctomycetota bacterium]
MSQQPSHVSLEEPTRVRYGVLGFACSLSMITYLDRVCFGTVAPLIQAEFDLSNTQKGLLFSAFALAYAAFEVPSGWLGDVFGPRRTLIRIVLWWSVFTALTGAIYPSEQWPYFAFIAMLSVRFFFGMGEAGCYPNIARAFHNWFPFTERGFAQGAVWMAGRFAGGVTPFIVLALLHETTAGGETTTHWRHTFWIFGSLGVFWCMLFWWWFRDRPEQKAGVNRAEIELIQHGESHEAAHAGVPWGRLFSNLNLWVLCMMYFCAAYGWYFNITYLPGYLRDVFGLREGAKWTSSWWQFSIMAGAPLLLGSVACLFGGLLTDWFIRRTGNRKWGRRLFGIIGHGVCALCYCLSILASDPWLFVLAIAMAAFWNDITMGAAWASCLDIGRRYSGIVAGCMNTIGNLGGTAAGFLTGWILDMNERFDGDKVNPTGWTINFAIFGGVYLVATLLWLRFDSTKPVLPDESGITRLER